MKRLRNECNKPTTPKCTDSGAPLFSRVGGIKDEIESTQKRQENLEKKFETLSDNWKAQLEENNKKLISDLQKTIIEHQEKIMQDKINSSLHTFRIEHNKEINQNLAAWDHKLRCDVIEAIKKQDTSILIRDQPKILDMDSFFEQKYGPGQTGGPGDFQN